MIDNTISVLPECTETKNELLFIVNDGMHSKRISFKNMAAGVNGVPGGGDPDTSIFETIEKSEADDAVILESANVYTDDSSEAMYQDIESNHDDLQKIKLELEALAPTLATGNWNYGTNLAPRPGEIQTASNTFTTSPDKILISELDAGGSTHGFANVEIGSFIELIDTDDDYGLYEITGKSPAIGLFEFDVALVRGLGEPDAGALVSVRVFDVSAIDPETLNSKVDKSGDTMTGALEVEGRIHAKNMIDMHSTKIINLETPTNGAGAANKSYVDSQVAKKLKLTGGTVSGLLTVENKIHAKNMIDMHSTKIINLETPTNAAGAANKSYVDNKTREAIEPLLAKIAQLEDKIKLLG